MDAYSTYLAFIRLSNYNPFTYIQDDDIGVTELAAELSIYLTQLEHHNVSPDSLPSNLPVHSAGVLSDAFTTLLNKSLSLPLTPDCWKPIIIVLNPNSNNFTALAKRFHLIHLMITFSLSINLIDPVST